MIVIVMLLTVKIASMMFVQNAHVRKKIEKMALQSMA